MINPERIVLNYLFALILGMIFLFNPKIVYSRSSLSQKVTHKNALVRQKVVSLMDKHFSSENPTDKSSFNNNIKQLVTKMSYPLNDSSRVGLIVKNKMKVGISMEF